MSLYRNRLPQLGSDLFLTDGGLETTLVYHEGIDLPYFAAFDLLRTGAGTETLRGYFHRYVAIARKHGVGIVLESPSWRANPDWARRIGYDEKALTDANRRSIGLLLEIRDALQTPATPIVISGNLGPRGDGYRPGSRMTVREARDYHAPQVECFAASDADMAAAFTMNYVEEAVGIAQAARGAQIPVAISFTVETDGRLPSGDTLQQAIARTDEETGAYPVYYLINCAHPSHFLGALRESGNWRDRIRGVRANASRRSHAELDACTDLDSGDPEELAADYRSLRKLLPALTVLGGCCGTDHRHIEAIGAACRPAVALRAAC